MDRHGIFAGDDPFEITKRWLDEAWESEINDANAIALSTVDAQGMPNLRMVLLKTIEADAFVFYTNYTSAKASELDGAGKAAFLFHWKSLRRQIRVRGRVSRADDEAADLYYASRPLGSRLGAWASRQSTVIADRGVLEARLREAEAEFGENPPRPPFWGGYRLVPDSFEFWAEGEYRLHNRFRWLREGDGWHIDRLSP